MAVFLQVPRLADGSLPHFLATESYDRWPESDPQWGTDGVRNETNAHWVQGLAASGGRHSAAGDMSITIGFGFGYI